MQRLEDLNSRFEKSEAEQRQQEAAARSDGRLKDLRYQCMNFRPEDNTISVFLTAVPMEKAVSIHLVCNGEEIKLTPTEAAEPAFETELTVPIAEPCTVTGLVIVHAGEEERIKMDWMIYPYESVMPEIESTYSAAVAPIDFYASDTVTYSGKISCTITELPFMWNFKARDFVTVVNGEEVSRDALFDLKMGSDIYVKKHYSLKLNKTGSTDITEYIITAESDTGLSYRHTALRVTGNSVDSFYLNGTTKVYNTESGEFLFTIP